MLGHSPNQWAFEHLWDRPERFIVGTTGRQVGKSSEAKMRIDYGLNKSRDPEDRSEYPDIPAVGVLGSKYEKAEISVDKYIETITRTFGTSAYHLNQNEHILTVRDPRVGRPGATLRWISAEDAYNAVGFTFSHIIIDEAQAIPDDVYTKFRPTWGVRHATADIFGTPDTLMYQTWFQGLFGNGQNELDKNYHSFSVATWDAPWMTMEEILDAKRTMTEREFRRLYGGEWIEDAGLVFRDIDQAWLARVPKYDQDRTYIMSVDLAIHEDFNVVLVGDTATRTPIFKARWNESDPLATYDRISEIWTNFGKPYCFADETGMGAAMVPELRDRGIRTEGIVFTNQNKMEMLKQLAGDLQHRRTMLPEEWTDLKQELGQFVYVRTPSGRLSAQARVGAHDDIVMALVMLNHGFRKNSRYNSTFQHNYLRGDGGRPTPFTRRQTRQQELINAFAD